MEQRASVWKTLLIPVVALALFSCSDDSDETTGSGGDSDDERIHCTQASQCPGGRENSICSPEGECFTRDEYCRSDEECKGKCLPTHLCENGKTEAADGPGLSQDSGWTPPPGDGAGQGGDDDSWEFYEPCQYQCCKDEDCSKEYPMFCDLDTHTCVPIVPCSKECCQDWDCWQKYGSRDYICRFNTCVDKNAGCDYEEHECCENKDCLKYGPEYVCEAWRCVSHVVNCRPGEQDCCTHVPHNTLCFELEGDKDAYYVTCNRAGDGWKLEDCGDKFYCSLTGSEKIACDPIDSCQNDGDCACPKQCLQGTNGKFCQLPMAEPGERCRDYACDSEEAIEIANCPPHYTCCKSDDAEEPDIGYCIPETQCND